MLIDRYMPRWHARERHSTRIYAGADRVYEALHSTDLCHHSVTRGLLAARALPAALSSRARRREWRVQMQGPVTLSVFEERGFRILAEDPPNELLLGLEGAFWRLGGDLHPVTADSFRRPVRLGLARAAWNFAIHSDGSESCVLSTETRVLAGDPSTRRRFRIYWFVIRPASGLIRRLMLRAVKNAAERSPALSELTTEEQM